MLPTFDYLFSESANDEDIDIELRDDGDGLHGGGDDPENRLLRRLQRFRRQKRKRRSSKNEDSTGLRQQLIVNFDQTLPGAHSVCFRCLDICFRHTYSTVLMIR